MSDILQEMTKSELIFWIKSKVLFRRPKRSWLLFRRWEVGTEKLEAEEKAKILAEKKIDMKKRDEYARHCNATNVSAEKLKWIKLMMPYDKAYLEHINRNKKLRDKQIKLDRMYDQVCIERDKE